MATIYPNRTLTGLAAQSGDQMAQLNLSGQQAEQVGQNVPNDQPQRFGLALLDLLRQHQQLGTRPFVEQQLGAQDLQAQRTAQETPASFIGASPDVQSGVRAASVSAVQPTVAGAQQSAQTFSEQLQSFGTSIDRARGLIKDFEESQNKKRDDARALVQSELQTFGSEAFEGADPQEVAQLLKLAGYPKDYIDYHKKSLKQIEADNKKQFGGTVDLGDKVAILDQQGKVLRYESKGIKPGDPGYIPPSPTPEAGAQEPEYDFESREGIEALPVSELTKSIIAGYGTTKELTPTDKALVKTELYRVGFNPYEYINRKLDGLVEQWEKIPSNFKGLVQGRAQPWAASRDAEVANFESMKQVLTREVARLFDVGVLSDQDVASYKTAMPSRGDRNLDVVKGKIKGLETTLGGALVKPKADPLNVRKISIKLGSPLAQANNNPGNLRFVGQRGATQGKGGFARFESPQAGLEALVNQISLDATRGHTLASFINKYAPPRENDTQLYVRQATKALGVSPQTLLKNVDRNQLVRFMAKKESSTTIG